MDSRIERVSITGDVAALRRQRGALARGAQGHVRRWGGKDAFTVAATPASTYPLTCIPVKGTAEVYLNGDELEEGTGYTVDYDTESATAGTLTVSASLAAGDLLTARYLKTDWLVARSLPPEVDPIPPSTYHVLSGVDATAPVGPTFTPGASVLLLACLHWGRVVADSTGVSISDTWGLTWTRLGEAIHPNFSAPPSNGWTVGCTVFSAVAPSVPTSGTVLGSFPYRGSGPETSTAAWVVEIVEIPNAEAVGDVSSGHSAINTGTDVSSLTMTLATAPSSDQATYLAFTNWPHKVITWDADYTQIDEGNNVGGSGPYFQEIRHGIAYNVSSPDATATATNSTGTADSAGVLVTLVSTA